MVHLQGRRDHENVRGIMIVTCLRASWATHRWQVSNYIQGSPIGRTFTVA